MTDDSIVRCLAQAERPEVRPETQLLRDIRAVVSDLVQRGNATEVTPGLMKQVNERVTNGGAPR